MNYLDIINDSYTTSEKPVGPLDSMFPSTLFYMRFIWIVCKSSLKAKRDVYDDEAWAKSSHEVFTSLEGVGLHFEIDGLEHLSRFSGPCVFIGNHMSMMETVVLPVMILPYKRLTFVVKESLLNYPVFKHIMQSRNPVAITRTNPRQDLKTVMSEGVTRLKDSISVMVFPQTTRSTSFDPEQMSTIGVKLAKKAGVPIVPVALKTDAWSNGQRFKDFGKIEAGRSTHFSFGEPIVVEGKGTEEQQRVNSFIQGRLASWK